MNSVNISVLKNVPEIKKDDNVGNIISLALREHEPPISSGDVLCIAHKIISKAEGREIGLDTICPSPEARKYSAILNKDPRKVQTILNESINVIRYFKHNHQNEGVMICESRLGFISANAGVDESNIGGKDTVLLLPKDPDLSARKIRDHIKNEFGVSVGIVITDTFGRPWRVGQVNVAIGLAGVPATKNEKGGHDYFGKLLKVTEPAFCDEIAAASGLLVGKSDKTPVVIFRGLTWKSKSGNAKQILRKTEEDMFL